MAQLKGTEKAPLKVQCAHYTPHSSGTLPLCLKGWRENGNFQAATCEQGAWWLQSAQLAPSRCSLTSAPLHAACAAHQFLGSASGPAPTATSHCFHILDGSLCLHHSASTALLHFCHCQRGPLLKCAPAAKNLGLFLWQVYHLNPGNHDNSSFTQVFLSVSHPLSLSLPFSPLVFHFIFTLLWSNLINQINQLFAVGLLLFTPRVLFKSNNGCYRKKRSWQHLTEDFLFDFCYGKRENSFKNEPCDRLLEFAVPPDCEKQSLTLLPCL